MSTPKKSTVLLSAVASSLLLAACAPNQPVLNAADHPSMVIAEVNPPSAADLYAQRYPSSFGQVTTGSKHRFVSCDPSCPGATPKTPLSNLINDRLGNSTVSSAIHDRVITIVL